MNLSFAAIPDSRILVELGERVRRERLNQNRTQTELADSAAVGLIVIKRLEAGKGCNLSSFIRVLRALGKLDELDSFLPEPGISPLQLARLAGRRRKHASGTRAQNQSHGNQSGD